MKKSIVVLLACLFAFAEIHSNYYQISETDDYQFAETDDYQITEADDSRPAGFSVTDRYLIEHPLESIRESVSSDQFGKQLPLMKKMIAKEKESGFFGYHGCSQRYRIFQDILRAVFEEALGYDIPSDFQFLRIPGDEMFDLKNGKLSFYKLFDRKEPSESIKMKIIDSLFIKPFNEEFNSSMLVKDLTSKEKKELWGVALEFLETLDTLAMEDYYSYEFDDEKRALTLPVDSNALSPNPYMQSIRKKLEMIMRKLDSQEQIGSRMSSAPSESVEKLHTVFMRILKKKQKKVDSIQVKNQISMNYKFGVLIERVYSLSYEEYEGPLWNFFFPYNDHIPGQQSRIICLNMPLFGNYYRPGESSLYVFLNGYSIASGDSAVMELLSKYFEEIGLNKKLPEVLRNIAVDELSKSTNQNGSILQFFDLSEENGKTPLEGADASAYVSHSFGIPLKHLEPSQLILNEHPIQQNNLDLQLRLIPCNHTTLNPYSFLRVIRYDSQDPKISKKIIEQMRNKLKGGIVDIKKLNAYKSKMDSTWGH